MFICHGKLNGDIIILQTHPLPCDISSFLWKLVVDLLNSSWKIKALKVWKLPAQSRYCRKVKARTQQGASSLLILLLSCWLPHACLLVIKSVFCNRWSKPFRYPNEKGEVVWWLGAFSLNYTCVSARKESSNMRETVNRSCPQTLTLGKRNSFYFCFFVFHSHLRWLGFFAES